MPIRKVLIFLSGEAPARKVLEGELPAFVVAADGGAAIAVAAGLRPDVVVGDMDSVDPTLLTRLESGGARVELHPREKLLTDGALAVDAALRLAPEAQEMVFVAALGGRLDLSLANVGLFLRALKAGVRVRALERGGSLTVVTAAAHLRWEAPAGQVVSVVALTPEASGLRISGVRWPLPRLSDPPEGATVFEHDPYAVSNVALGGIIEVSVVRGVVAVVEPTDGTATAHR
ncbi:MAG: thiamine diphosphokinase [Thermoplasmatota archaeon]